MSGAVIQEARVQRVQAHPQKFRFGENPGKIPENPDKISGNLGKICENLCKIPENLGKLPENTSKNGAQPALIKKWRPICFYLKKLIPKSHIF